MVQCCAGGCTDAAKGADDTDARYTWGAGSNAWDGSECGMWGDGAMHGRSAGRAGGAVARENGGVAQGAGVWEGDGGKHILFTSSAEGDGGSYEDAATGDGDPHARWHSEGAC